jgi:hypothetical protein
MKLVLPTLLTALLLSVPAAAAQNGASEATVRPVPFGPGERLSYNVKVGVLNAGRAGMEVVRLERINGHQTYHLRFTLQGGIAFARVNDKLSSWMDVSTLVTRRFEQDQHELRFKRHRIYNFFPEERRFARLDKEETGELPTDQPLDEVSFLYFVRTLPLEVGRTYTFHRYFKNDGNPVVLKVLRRETVRVPAGTFNTIVVQPIIQTSGLFGEGGNAEVYFTDDDRRLLVQMRANVPKFPGSLHLFLDDYRPGQQLAGPFTLPATR